MKIRQISRQIGIGLEFSLFYASLSSFGRQYFKALIKMSRRGEMGDDSSFKEVFEVPWERKLLLRNFKETDRAFHRYLPKNIGSANETDRKCLYLRFVPFGWFMHGVRVRVCEAYRIPYDKIGEVRSILNAFLHREWNDLADKAGMTQEQIRQSVDFSKELSNPVFELNRHLFLTIQTLMPQGAGSQSYKVYLDAKEKLDRIPTEETAKEVTAARGKMAVQIFAYAILNEFPECLEQISEPLGLWLYGLDELSDLEEDAKTGKITYMSTVDDPEREIWNIYEQCAKVAHFTAPFPERLLRFMKIVTEGVIKTRHGDRNIENIFLGRG